VPLPLGLLDPRALARALDDLHQIAIAARTLPRIETRLTERIDALERRASDLLAAAERLDSSVDAVLAMGDRILERGDAVLEQGGALAQVAEGSTRLAEALPALQRAIELVEPLQGATERLGRIVDRLPGAPRPTRRGTS